MVSAIIDNLKMATFPIRLPPQKIPICTKREKVNEVAAMGGTSGKNTSTANAPVSKVLLTVQCGSSWKCQYRMTHEPGEGE